MSLTLDTVLQKFLLSDVICILLLCICGSNAQNFGVLQTISDSYDYFGCSVSISADTVVVGANQEASNATGVNGDQRNNNATSSGAAYVFVRDGAMWTQQAYLKASNTQRHCFFGSAVSISGDTIVVGAYGEDSDASGVNGDQNNARSVQSGAAYVFVRNGTVWTQQAYLKASNNQYFAGFGYSVSISGDTIVVGAYTEYTNATGVNGPQNNTDAPFSGAAYVFVRDGITWTQQAYLKASNAELYDYFGTSVSISGDTIVVGANEEDSSATGVNGDQNSNDAINAGAAYVFVRAGTTWTQQAYLKASNTGAGDQFGVSVSISGDTIVVGANEEDSNAIGVNGVQSNNDARNAGAAYVFVRNGVTWIQQAYLKASNTGENDNFGFSVSILGDIIVASARYEGSNATGVNGDQNNDNAPYSGAAYVFVRKGMTWTQQTYLKADSVLDEGQFGYSVAVDVDIVAGQIHGNKAFVFTPGTPTTTTKVELKPLQKLPALLQMLPLLLRIFSPVPVALILIRLLKQL
jgi:hypothetical protein